ncbi:MAG: M23 family metallopeptidase [Hyphomicrobiales bacterium]|nr:M23 family metallopeptidase [Hyphomicrobiales bacterium]
MHRYYPLLYRLFTYKVVLFYSIIMFGLGALVSQAVRGSYDENVPVTTVEPAEVAPEVPIAYPALDDVSEQMLAGQVEKATTASIALSEPETDALTKETVTMPEDEVERHAWLTRLRDSQQAQEYDVDMTIRRGDTVGDMLQKIGVGAQDVHEVSVAVNKVYSLRQLRAGQRIVASLKEDAGDTLKLSGLRIDLPEKYIEAKRTEDGAFNVASEEKQLTEQLVRAEGTIQSSLLGLASSLGIPHNIMAQVISAYSFDVDFQRDIHDGSKFELLYKIAYDHEGREVGAGEVQYASLDVAGHAIKIFQYKTLDGRGDFYREDGRSVRKALMKTPINGAVLSSRYGPRRHPILGYNRMHKGVDFAAPTGTPIFAAGDGRIDFIGRKGGYGKYLRIRHNGKYSTAYAHLSRYAKGMKNGTRVRQGQVVAYVGTTGASTGPHLHYEILVNGTQVNPLAVKVASGKKLSGDELVAFKQKQTELYQTFASLPVKKQLAKR